MARAAAGLGGVRVASVKQCPGGGETVIIRGLAYWPLLCPSSEPAPDFENVRPRSWYPSLIMTEPALAGCLAPNPHHECTR